MCTEVLSLYVKIKRTVKNGTRIYILGHKPALDSMHVMRKHKVMIWRSHNTGNLSQKSSQVGELESSVHKEINDFRNTSCFKD